MIEGGFAVHSLGDFIVGGFLESSHCPAGTVIDIVVVVVLGYLVFSSALRHCKQNSKNVRRNKNKKRNCEWFLLFLALVMLMKVRQAVLTAIFSRFCTALHTLIDQDVGEKK